MPYTKRFSDKADIVGRHTHTPPPHTHTHLPPAVYDIFYIAYTYIWRLLLFGAIVLAVEQNYSFGFSCIIRN